MLSKLLSLLVLLPAIQAYDRAACQRPDNKDIEKSCPKGTIIVGPSAKFKTIQSAVLSLPKDKTPQTILIQAGTYNEQVNVSRAGPVTLLGVTASPNSHTGNLAKVLWKAATGTSETGKGDNAFTATLTVAPTLDAALTGSGPTGHAIPAGTPFGNVDFRAYNIDFSNEYKQASAGPSLAVSTGMANTGFYFCGVRSWQDTVYIGKKANAYFHKGEIAGFTDFMYGFGTAWVQAAKVALRGCGGGITAWKGTNGTNKYGVYVVESEVGKAEKSTAGKGKCYLGRPWNDAHRSIFAKCKLDDSIAAAGYKKWAESGDTHFSAKTFMAEYGNTGPGFNAAGRKESRVSKVLSAAEYEPYSTVAKVFGDVAWIDKSPESKGETTGSIKKDD
ncbi:pectin lyase-like protein [Venturia nashicola]|uniref:pectinesterase n=1 Tax=Venturia nashicola TaxID=86259 RepID=A0A4Z1P7X4_9PEZI|nr:pectin lyase-like protein [Venturia nashicola]